LTVNHFANEFHKKLVLIFSLHNIIGEARTKLMGIEENDNGQGNGSMVN